MFCVRAGSKTNKQRRKFISKQLKWKINCKYNIKQVKFVLIFVFLSAKNRFGGISKTLYISRKYLRANCNSSNSSSVSSKKWTATDRYLFLIFNILNFNFVYLLYFLFVLIICSMTAVIISSTWLYLRLYNLVVFFWKFVINMKTNDLGTLRISR